MLEVVGEQEGPAVRGPALQDSEARVRWHVRVLKVRLDHPTLVAVSVKDVIDRAVVLQKRRGETARRRLPSVPASHERQCIG